MMPANPKPPVALTFTPARTRSRHDGWTPAKQVAFIEALAESGCIHEACAAVGMARASAYRLRMRTDAQGFRIAWDAALDLAVRRLSDECYSRALNGEVVPHFYRGEQIGERRRYDNRLAMFLLRYRDPLRYAATLDQMVYAGHTEQAALAFARARDRVRDEAHDIPAAPDEAPAAPGLPWAATPVAAERTRQKEQAVVEGRAPLYGDGDKRREFVERRREYHRGLRAAAERSAVDGRVEE